RKQSQRIKIPRFIFALLLYNCLSPNRQTCDWDDVCFVFTNFICSVLVGRLSALFSYWLNNRNKK
ncbi:type I toxin-antitoxin system Fst family toxin, partial [Enterococcus faecalis]|nr:type I toxin-antitoxin system Fst family toxin [Enterococcus faecalis]